MIEYICPKQWGKKNSCRKYENGFHHCKNGVKSDTSKIKAVIAMCKKANGKHTCYCGDTCR